MLLVNAQSGPSSIHGMGLIAQELIPKGTKIWQFMPGFDVAIPAEEVALLSFAAQRTLDYYSYYHEPTRTFVLSADDDRFTNHSDTPNTAPLGNNTVAIREILAGEEITVNYNNLCILNFD